MSTTARRRAIAAGVVAVALLGACGDDDSTGETLVPLDGSSGNGPAATVAGDIALTAETALDPADAGSGFVSIQVRLPVVGIDESISLDRASVHAGELDPVSLDATCTALDGGDGLTVSVVDLRRLSAGSRLVSAALRVDGEPTAGEHDVTLDLSGADQVTTQYTGKIQVAEGASAGTFEVVDAAGNVASGSFACTAEAVAATTTVPPAGGGEELPPTVAPSTTSTTVVATTTTTTG